MRVLIIDFPQNIWGCNYYIIYSLYGKLYIIALFYIHILPVVLKLLAVYEVFQLLKIFCHVLNQERAACGRRASGFLELLLPRMSVCVCVCVCVCVSTPRLLITSDMIWTPYDWLNKFYGFYMVAVVDIDSGRDVSIYTRRGN